MKNILIKVLLNMNFLPILFILTSFWIIIQAGSDDPTPYTGCNKLSYNDCLKICHCAICYESQGKTVHACIVKYPYYGIYDVESDFYIMCQKKGNVVDPDPKIIQQCKDDDDQRATNGVIIVISILGFLLLCICCVIYCEDELCYCCTCQCLKNLPKRIMTCLKRLWCKLSSPSNSFTPIN